MHAASEEEPVLLITLLGVVLTVAACGTAPAGQEPDDTGGRVAVDGMVIADGDRVRICYSVMESYPPQCGGGIAVEGLDPDDLPDADTASGVTFGQARLVGELRDGTLHVDEAPGTAQPQTTDDPPTRELDQTARERLRERFTDEVHPILEEDTGAWLDAYPDEAGGYIRVTVVDERGALAQRLRDTLGDDVDVHGWVTHLD
jgi:hypothetical protein